MKNSAIENPRQVDLDFVKKIKIGTQIFHYPATGSPKKSFADSSAAEYTLYSVVDIPTINDVVLMGSFDKKEEKKIVTKAALLSGDWWHRPD